MARYEIRVAGEIPAAEVGELEGMAVSADGPYLRLSGDVVDQSALLGMLARLTGLRLRVTGVRALPARRPSRPGAGPDEVQLRGRAALTLARHFPTLQVREEEDVTVVSGRLADPELHALLQLGQSLRADVILVHRADDAATGSQPVGPAVTRRAPGFAAPPSTPPPAAAE
jgi:hypothetical protein